MTRQHVALTAPPTIETSALGPADYAMGDEFNMLTGTVGSIQIEAGSAVT